MTSYRDSFPPREMRRVSSVQTTEVSVCPVQVNWPSLFSGMEWSATLQHKTDQLSKVESVPTSHGTKCGFGLSTGNIHCFGNWSFELVSQLLPSHSQVYSKHPIFAFPVSTYMTFILCQIGVSSVARKKYWQGTGCQRQLAAAAGGDLLRGSGGMPSQKKNICR